MGCTQWAGGTSCLEISKKAVKYKLTFAKLDEPGTCLGTEIHRIEANRQGHSFNFYCYFYFPKEFGGNSSHRRLIPSANPEAKIRLIPSTNQLAIMARVHISGIQLGPTTELQTLEECYYFQFSLSNQFFSLYLAGLVGFVVVIVVVCLFNSVLFCLVLFLFWLVF